MRNFFQTLLLIVLSAAALFFCLGAFSMLFSQDLTKSIPGSVFFALIGLAFAVYPVRCFARRRSRASSAPKVSSTPAIPSTTASPSTPASSYAPVDIPALPPQCLDYLFYHDLLERSVVAIDLETTGLDVSTCGIVSMAAVRVTRGKISDTFSTLVNPGFPIPAPSTAIHHITDDMVLGAPAFPDAYARLRAFIASDKLVGHNLRGFDLPVLLAHCVRFCAPSPESSWVDTLSLSRQRLPDLSHYALSDCAACVGCPVASAHDALSDATACAGIAVAFASSDHDERMARHRAALKTPEADRLRAALASLTLPYQRSTLLSSFGESSGGMDRLLRYMDEQGELTLRKDGARWMIVSLNDPKEGACHDQLA